MSEKRQVGAQLQVRVPQWVLASPAARRRFAQDQAWRMRALSAERRDRPRLIAQAEAWVAEREKAIREANDD